MPTHYICAVHSRPGVLRLLITLAVGVVAVGAITQSDHIVRALLVVPMVWLGGGLVVGRSGGLLAAAALVAEASGVTVIVLDATASTSTSEATGIAILVALYAAAQLLLATQLFAHAIEDHRRRPVASLPMAS